MDLTLVIPTHNERENLAALLPTLLALPEAEGLYILVVDDESRDGTAQMAQEWSERDARVSLLRGRKRGLGDAYRRGIGHALRHLPGRWIGQMDADFGHRPEDLPKLLAAARAGADMVIGSRYVPGGALPPDWPRYRRWLSSGGNWAAQKLAGLEVRDATAGFRIWDRRLLERIFVRPPEVEGYAFQLALLAEAVMLGARVREVPVPFFERSYGRSKLGAGDILEFGLLLCRLLPRRRRLREATP